MLKCNSIRCSMCCSIKLLCYWSEWETEEDLDDTCHCCQHLVSLGSYVNQFIISVKDNCMTAVLLDKWDVNMLLIATSLKSYLAELPVCRRHLKSWINQGFFFFFVINKFSLLNYIGNPQIRNSEEMRKQNIDFNCFVLVEWSANYKTPFARTPINMLPLFIDDSKLHKVWKISSCFWQYFDISLAFLSKFHPRLKSHPDNPSIL